jgi:aminopeptidase N
MAVLSLTQVEAERRAALLDVDSYDITVDLTGLPDGPEVRCVSQITFTCREPGTETFVDCAADILTATLNGQPLPPADGGRIRLPKLAARNVLRVESVQADTREGEGVHRTVDPTDGEVYVWTTFEPDEARFVWACFDQPDLKAPHTFTVLAPAHWTVLSNSGDPVVEDISHGRRWRFPVTPRLSTYNTVVNAGPFHEIRRDIADHDLGIFARRSLREILERDAEEIFTLTGQGLRFFSDVFAMPFPQRKYDQVYVPEFGGAMENFGCVTWDDSFLRRSTPTPGERDLFARFLLHEMAHMWFGNIVTMRWWDDLWLNEAFAEFAAHWAAERATRYTDVWTGHLAGWKQTAYLADQGPISHPIRQPIGDVAQAASIFDAITYPKGASVLKQLMTYVGEDAFAAGMTQYFADHAWGSTTLQDLIDALAAAGGRDLDAWRRAWLETAGTDRLTLRHDADGLILEAAGPGGGAPRPHVLRIGAYRRDGDGLTRVGVADVEVRGPHTRVELPPADLHLINDEDRTFATTRPADREALFAAAPALPTPIARAVATASVWDMFVGGEATVVEAVGVLTSVLRVETADSVIEPYLTRAVDAADLWAPAAGRAAIAARVAATARALAEHPVRRQVALRAFARVASDVEELAWLERMAGDDADLRWRALIRRAELGEPTDDAVSALLDSDPDPDARNRALAVRAARPDAGAKRETWQALAVERTVPFESVREVAAAFWRPGQEDLLAPYARQYPRLVPGLGRGGMIAAGVFTAALFPVVAVDVELLARAEEAGADATPIVRSKLLERADVVRRMLRSRG